MEANEYETGHLDSDVLLPPRKRLLAGLKRQSSESTSQSSPENSNCLSEFDIRLHNLLKSCKNGPHMSPEEIAKAAQSAANAAAKAAEAARAAAEEKAVIAAKAVAAAKKALSLVASFSKDSGGRGGVLKKNKMKKHVPVQLLYEEQQARESNGTDEEIARKLHRAINSSPRISKHSPGSKNKNKKLKHSLHPESNGVPNGTSPCGAEILPVTLDSEGSFEESYVAKVYGKGSKSSKFDQVQETTSEAESSRSKDKNIESQDGVHANGRKRGRIKQKKLPLSLCNNKDRANPRDELNQSGSELAREVPGKSTMECCASTSISVDRTPAWKCQGFKVPQCIKPDKGVQS